MSGSKKAGSKYGTASPGGLLGNDNESLSSEISTSERERFDDVTETILIELEAVCMDEQSFSIHFFKMETRFVNSGLALNLPMTVSFYLQLFS